MRMRVLAFSDVHASQRGAETIVRMVAERSPDVIAIAGDVTDFGSGDFARDLLVGMPVITLVVPGNMDTAAAAAAFSAGKAKNLHLRKELVGGVPFVGLGGWIASPSRGRPWGIDPHDAELAISKLLTEGAVLLTHVPAYGHLDKVPIPPAFSAGKEQFEHIGSQNVRLLVERFKPAVVISGHVHEDRGIEMEGGSLFVNPGPAKNGFGAVIELSGRPRAELLTLSR